MIADWSVEAGPDSPVIEVPWPGWVDLQSIFPGAQHRGDALQLSETAAYPEIQTALRIANSTMTATSKMDIFPVARDEVDMEIAETLGVKETSHGLCSYLDCFLLRGNKARQFEYFERMARQTAANLSRAGPKGAGAEIVIRPALVHGEETYGWTLYAFAFGRTEDEARSRWASSAVLVSWMFQLSIAGTL